MSDKKHGSWAHRPVVPILLSPLFAWPLRPGAIFQWFRQSWFNLSIATALLIFALIAYAFLVPAHIQYTELRVGWISQIFARNLLFLTIVAGGLQLFLNWFKGQGDQTKFDPRNLAKNNKQFLFRNQVLDNMFWSIASGVSLITVFEACVLWAQANGVGIVTYNIAWLVFGLLLIPIWSSFHFYWVHRFLHWPPLYKVAHALHHKNIVTGPWTGISMHPVEHLLYFSSLLIHLILPSHPIHVLFHVYLLILSPPMSHSGFENLIIAQNRVMRIGDFFHQLHHRYFEVNYGTAEMPWDKWFGSFDDGTDESRTHHRKRLQNFKR